MKRTFLMAVAGLAVLACGQQQQPAALAPQDPGSYRLYLRDYSSISVADAATGQVVSSLPSGVPTSDWSRLYAVSQVSGGSTLRALDVASGQKLAEMQLPGVYELPFVSTPLAAVSPNGRWIGLSHWDYAQATGITASHFAVAESDLRSPARQIDLRGYWNLDALSNDGRWLYLIQNLSNGYRVRLYDLTAGALNPKPVIDPSDGDKPMTGERLDSVAAPDGSWIYSLYATNGGGAFIHALPVASGSTSAVCIDLPDIRSRGSMTLALSSDGSRIYVTDGLANTVQEIVAPGAGGTGKIARSLRLPARRAAFNPFVVAAAAAGPGDGPGSGMHSVITRGGLLYFPATTGLAAVDVKTWTFRGRYLDSEHFRTLTLSSDGRWLYGLTDSQRLIRVDPASGQRLQDLRSGPWSLQLERATPLRS